jgi:hypothetical protein
LLSLQAQSLTIRSGQALVRPSQNTQNIKKIRRISYIYSSAYVLVFGGAEGNRTPDLLNAIQALSQLSYDPTGFIKASPL